MVCQYPSASVIGSVIQIFLVKSQISKFILNFISVYLSI